MYRDVCILGQNFMIVKMIDMKIVNYKMIILVGKKKKVYIYIYKYIHYIYVCISIEKTN